MVNIVCKYVQLNVGNLKQNILHILCFSSTPILGYSRGMYNFNIQ